MWRLTLTGAISAPYEPSPLRSACWSCARRTRRSARYVDLERTADEPSILEQLQRWQPNVDTRATKTNIWPVVKIDLRGADACWWRSHGVPTQFIHRLLRSRAWCLPHMNECDMLTLRRRILCKGGIVVAGGVYNFRNFDENCRFEPLKKGTDSPPYLCSTRYSIPGAVMADVFVRSRNRRPRQHGLGKKRIRPAD
jgi:hypothetical protein